MADMTQSNSTASAKTEKTGSIARFISATELDTRLLGMVGALLLIWIGFHILSGGLFLTPRNLWNLSVQTASVAVMATGMVLVIVTRNIDLSVGSILGFSGMIMGVMQAEILPQILGFEHWATWIVTLLVGILVGGAIGMLQGSIIAFLNVPSFIVTLGGLLVWRGGTWFITSGRTVAPMDSTFRLMGGGTSGSIGATWSWIAAVIACVAIIAAILNSRHQRRRFGFPLRPVWAEYFLAALGCLVVIGFVAVVNSYPWPVNIARNYADANGNCPWRFPSVNGGSGNETPMGRDYMGGDIRGVIEKLDYLQKLGVTVIYFNPIFDAGSNHSYDTQDFMRLDPYFGNAQDWADLIEQANRRGMHVVLDGVFNHLSSDSAFFDRYGNYDTIGACEDGNSPYRNWFHFRAPAGSEASRTTNSRSARPAS